MGGTVQVAVAFFTFQMVSFACKRKPGDELIVAVAAGNVEAAAEVLAQMKSSGVHPDAATFTRLFSTAWVRAEAERIRSARQLATAPTHTR